MLESPSGLIQLRLAADLFVHSKCKDHECLCVSHPPTQQPFAASTCQNHGPWPVKAMGKPQMVAKNIPIRETVAQVSSGE